MPPLRDLIATIPLAVEVSAPATLPVPAVVTATLVAAVEEALLNTLRHAGVDRARVTCRAGRRTGDPGGGPLSVSVVVQDEGVGFDPAAVPGTRRGLSESVHGRMAAIGGRARVRSRPGRGTRVVLRWPA